MCVALLAYGREELHHGKPETDVYDMKVETLVEPFKEAFLDVSFTTDVPFTIYLHWWLGYWTTDQYLSHLLLTFM